MSNSTIKDRIDYLQRLDMSKLNDRYDEEKIILSCNELYFNSKEVNNKKGMLVSIATSSCIYINRADTHSCLKVSREGLQLAEELKNYNYYSLLLGIKGRALLLTSDYMDARSSLLKAIEKANLIKDKDSMYLRKLSIYEALSDYAYDIHETNNNVIYKDSILYFAEKSYNQSLNLSKKYSDRNVQIGRFALKLGNTYVFLDNMKEGKKYFNIAERLLVNSRYKFDLPFLYTSVGHMEFKQGNDENALNYYEKALTLSKNTNYTPLNLMLYSVLAEYYHKHTNSKMELYYLGISKTLNDSLSKINQHALIAHSANKIGLIKENNRFDSYILIILMITASVILNFLISVYYYRKKKIKSDTSNELELKDREFLKNKMNEEAVKSLLEMAKSNDKQFLMFFQEIYPDLHKGLLKFQELTSSDLELCAYLKLNIQTKEIATYKKTSIGAVDNRKYRIRKKLNLLPETNLYKWINTIL